MTREAPPVKRISAATQPLVIGAEGRWNETKFRIITHAVVEIAEPGVIFDRHEYTLADDFGTTALLVCGDAPGATDWTLYAPLAPLLPPTSFESAAKKSGDVVNVDGVTATITELFQSTVKSADALELPSIRAGDVSFGYAARGVVFAVIGCFLIQAALHFDPNAAKGIDGAQNALAHFSDGLLGLIAAGLIAFGSFMFVEARYTEITIECDL